MFVLSSSLYDEMSFYNLKHNQDNSYYNEELMKQQHAWLWSICCESYSCNLFVSEIILKSARVSYINHIKESLSVTFFKQHKLMKQSSDHHILNAVTHQSSSYDHTSITL